MYRLTLNDTDQYQVHYKNHVIHYSTDGSLPNPLEATYAALTGCAGVYSRKACKALGISAEGITIDCKPVVRAGSRLLPERFVTEVRFPDHFPAIHRQVVLDEIQSCAVKLLIHRGERLEFVTQECPTPAPAEREALSR